MRTLRSRLIAFGLAFVLMPGAFEAVENTVHFVKEGHLAHLASAEGHQDPEGDEHGCNSVFHLCSCHISQISVCPDVRPLFQLILAVSLPAPASEATLTGFRLPLDRPPAA